MFPSCWTLVRSKEALSVLPVEARHLTGILVSLLIWLRSFSDVSCRFHPSADDDSGDESHQAETPQQYDRLNLHLSISYRLSPSSSIPKRKEVHLTSGLRGRSLLRQFNKAARIPAEGVYTVCTFLLMIRSSSFRKLTSIQSAL